MRWHASDSLELPDEFIAAQPCGFGDILKAYTLGDVRAEEAFSTRKPLFRESRGRSRDCLLERAVGEVVVCGESSDDGFKKLQATFTTRSDFRFQRLHQQAQLRVISSAVTAKSPAALLVQLWHTGCGFRGVDGYEQISGALCHLVREGHISRMHPDATCVHAHSLHFSGVVLETIRQWLVAVQSEVMIRHLHLDGMKRIVRSTLDYNACPFEPLTVEQHTLMNERRDGFTGARILKRNHAVREAVFSFLRRHASKPSALSPARNFVLNFRTQIQETRRGAWQDEHVIKTQINSNKHTHPSP